jgi:hypothetical protein
MTTSSQPAHSFNDFFDIDNNTISITSGPASGDVYIDTNNMNSYNISTGAAGTIYTINSSDTITFNSEEYKFNWGDAEEFVDAFPDWQRVQDMCKKYPGLEIALRNFQTVYTLVKDDYDNPKDEG